MGDTKIEWTKNADGTQGKTWNPVRGCSKVSAGCARCYAEKIAARFCGVKTVLNETSGMYGIESSAPFHGFIDPKTRRWNGRVELVESMLDAPLRWRKPCRVFVNSMSDLFHEGLPNEAIARALAVVEQTERHTYQILTKRADRLHEFFIWYLEHGNAWPLRNVHLGVSVENQAAADERIPLLLQTPAAVRFVSAEPLLGPMDLQGPALKYLNHTGRSIVQDFRPYIGVNWVIVGGESGPGARPCDVQWIRSIVRQCREARVPCFVKQLGAFPVVEACSQHHYDFGDEIGRKARFSAVDPLHPSSGMWRVHFDSRKGADPTEWPEDLRVREIPEVAR